MQHAISIEGRSLIRTFLADATKDATISSRAMSKLGRKMLQKKHLIYLYQMRASV